MDREQREGQHRGRSHRGRRTGQQGDRPRLHVAWSNDERSGPPDAAPRFGQETGFGSIRAVPGPYSGRGPKGYRRADERIFEDVCERLTDHPDIDASDVTVRVENGEVTLEGTVESRRVKYLAEDVCEGIVGLVDVLNRLRVVPRREPAPGGAPPEVDH